MKQVLLIDDNPLQLKIREAVLRGAGLQVSIATTAESALATLRALRQHIGVVVTDHIMPGCGGVEVVRQIRALDPALPVIVLSGMAEAECAYEGLGVTFRAKPLPPLELITLLRSRLDDSGERRVVA